MKSTDKTNKNKLILNKLIIAGLSQANVKLINLDQPTDKTVRTCASRFGIMVCFGANGC